MPLGAGYTAEEQITGKAEHGGLQVIVYPMKRGHYEEMVKNRAQPDDVFFSSFGMPTMRRSSMGLAPGGLMRQEIYDDPHGVDVWDQDNGLRCFVHMVNSAVYYDVTGTEPPHKPPTAKDYNAAGLPWFEYYSDAAPIGGSKALSGLTSIGAKTIQKTRKPLKNNESVTPVKVKTIGTSNTVRQGNF
jgi:hypothetical protein